MKKIIKAKAKKMLASVNSKAAHLNDIRNSADYNAYKAKVKNDKDAINAFWQNRNQIAYAMADHETRQAMATLEKIDENAKAMSEKEFYAASAFAQIILRLEERKNRRHYDDTLIDDLIIETHIGNLERFIMQQAPYDIRIHNAFVYRDRAYDYADALADIADEIFDYDFEQEITNATVDNKLTFDVQAHSEPSTVKVNPEKSLLADLATFKALAANVDRLTNGGLLETIKEVELSTATMSLADYPFNKEKLEYLLAIEDIDAVLNTAFLDRFKTMEIDDFIAYSDQWHEIEDIVEEYRQIRVYNDEIIRSYEYIGGTDPDAFDEMIAQMEKDAAAREQSEKPAFAFDLQAHSVMSEPVTNKKFEMLANLAAMSTHVAEFSDADFLDVIEEELTFEYIAKNANDDISQALLQPIGTLIGAEIDNRLDHKDFIEAYDERYYHVGAQFDDVMRRHYFNLFIINEIGGTDPDAFDAMIAQMEKDAEARYYAEIHARVVNRRLCDIINLYKPSPDAFDAMIAQMEKDAARNAFTFDVQAHSDNGDAAESESIFPAAESIAPHMIVPTIAQAAEWIKALPDDDLQAAYQLAVTTHAKMTTLTKDRWIVDECLDTFAEEAKARGVNLIPCNDEPPIIKGKNDDELLSTIANASFALHLIDSDDNPEAFDKNEKEIAELEAVIRKYRPYLDEDISRAYHMAECNAEWLIEEVNGTK